MDLLVGVHPDLIVSGVNIHEVHCLMLRSCIDQLKDPRHWVKFHWARLIKVHNVYTHPHFLFIFLTGTGLLTHFRKRNSNIKPTTGTSLYFVESLLCCFHLMASFYGIMV